MIEIDVRVEVDMFGETAAHGKGGGREEAIREQKKRLSTETKTRRADLEQRTVSAHEPPRDGVGEGRLVGRAL